MREIILVVENEEANFIALTRIFETTYRIVQVENEESGIHYLESSRKQPVVVMLDFQIALKEDFKLLKKMRDSDLLKRIPVLLTMEESSKGMLEQAYALGICDVLFKPFDRNITLRRVNNLAELYRQKNGLANTAVVKDLLLQQDSMLAHHHDNLIKAVLLIIHNRNVEGVKHIRYMQEYTRILAKHYAKLYPRSRMTEEKINMIVQAAELHDIGKLTLPDFVINRPGRLSKSEMELMKEHTVQGGKIIRIMFDFREAEYRRISYNICLYHHEKYDGSGYPFGLKKDKIPVEAQLAGLADMYDVLVNMPKDGFSFSKERAYYMLMNGECGELSPRMKECLESAREQMEKCYLNI